MRITLAGAERIDDLEAVYRSLYEHHVAVSSWRPGPERGADEAWRRHRRRYERTLAQPGGLLLVAESDGEIVGALVAEIEDDVEGSDTFVVATRQGHVHDLAVLPTARGVGIGHALVERFERELRERGVPTYGLDVMAGNDTGIRFYERLGFEVAQVSLEKRLDAPGQS